MLSGLQEKTAANVFNKEAFLRKRSRITGLPPDPAVNYIVYDKQNGCESTVLRDLTICTF